MHHYIERNSCNILQRTELNIQSIIFWGCCPGCFPMGGEGNTYNVINDE